MDGSCEHKLKLGTGRLALEAVFGLELEETLQHTGSCGKYTFKQVFVWADYPLTGGDRRLS